MRDDVAAEMRIGSLARELGIAVRVINIGIEALKVRTDGPAPAWTDFREVNLNRSALPPDVVEPADVAVWAGAAFHELGHTLFSPRPGTRLWDGLDRLNDRFPGIHRSQNALEDQRQERALIARFRPMRGYLLAIAARLILRAVDCSPGRLPESERLANAFPLVVGRVWIPAATRKIVRDAFASQHSEALADAVASVVGEYQMLSDPSETESDRALALVVRFHQLMMQTTGNPPHGCNPGGNPGGRTGEPIPTPTTNDPVAEPGNPTDDDSDSGEPGPGEPGHTYGPGPGDGSETNPFDGPDAKPNRSLDDILSDALGDVLSADDVASDLGRLKDAARKATGALDAASRVQPDRFISPAPATVAVADAISDHLRRLQSASESSWDYGTDSGRFNVPRWFGSNDPDPSTAFDRFEPDSLLETSVAFVLLVDVSSSMWMHVDQLANAVWAIQTAADAVPGQIELHVVAFNHGAVIISEPGNRPGRMVASMNANGGTSPAAALMIAADALNRSGAGHRFAMILSDGEWSDETDSHPIIDLMNDRNVETVSVIFGNPRGDVWHHCRRFASVGSLSDLVPMFDALVTGAMDRRQ